MTNEAVRTIHQLLRAAINGRTLMLLNDLEKRDARARRNADKTGPAVWCEDLWVHDFGYGWGLLEAGLVTQTAMREVTLAAAGFDKIIEFWDPLCTRFDRLGLDPIHKGDVFRAAGRPHLEVVR